MQKFNPNYRKAIDRMQPATRQRLPLLFIISSYFAGGRERDTVGNTDLSAYTIMLVNPHSCKYRLGFSNIRPLQPAKSVRYTLEQPPPRGNTLRNTKHLEGPVFAKYPEIAGIKQKMGEQGAVYAAMSAVVRPCMAYLLQMLLRQ